jgi:hypothetical protein
VNYNTGQFTFGIAPGVVTVQLQYTKVLYRDERLLSVMGDAIRRMYPRVYKTGECYIAGTLNQWDYDLTSTTDVPVETSFGSGIVPSEYVASDARTDLAKPQTRIHTAQYLGANTAGTTSWRPFTNFGRTTAAAWHTDTAFMSGDVVKLVYSAPCTPPTYTTDTIDVPDAYIDLPVWYALGVLMSRKENVRARSDSYQSTAAANANPNGTQARARRDYMGMFNATLRDNPMRPMATEIRRTVPGVGEGAPMTPTAAVANDLGERCQIVIGSYGYVLRAMAKGEPALRIKPQSGSNPRRSTSRRITRSRCATTTASRGCS